MKLSQSTKVFCSYAYTGEDQAAVQARMRAVVDAFRDLGVTAFWDLDDPATAGMTEPKQFIDHDLKTLRDYDVVFVLMTSERRSEGMLMEVGAAYAAGKPLILARHTSAIGKTNLDGLVTQTFDWTTQDDLLAGIRALV